MARNTKVGSDSDAPPITQILAKFVALHPSRGWSEAVDHEAHRTFLSVYHGFAAGLVFGRAGEPEFHDEIVRRGDIANLRRKVVATVDEKIDAASADVTATLKGGRKVHVFVEHAIGSLERPMSDADLEAKFHGLADPVIGRAKSSLLIEACWKLGETGDVRTLAERSKP